MPTLSGKLTEKHNELVAKKEAARKEAEKLEKKKRDNARKKRSREVCVKKVSVILSLTQLAQCKWTRLVLHVTLVCWVPIVSFTCSQNVVKQLCYRLLLYSRRGEKLSTKQRRSE